MPTALIVEDEPEANHLLAMLVQLRGYRTHSAYTGGEALEKVRLELPDIVFLDLMLPDINGYEVCKELKSGKETSLIPVVMVTARIASENRLQSFRVGADDYIPKPYTPDQIFQAIADADARKRDVEGQNTEGVIRLGERDEGESLRQIAQLRNLLVGRTSLESAEVGRIGTALKEIQASAEIWGRSHSGEFAATIAYQLQDGEVRLTLTDGAEWIKCLVRQEGWQKWAIRPFDEVSVEDSGERVCFLKTIRPGDSPEPG